MQGPYNTNNVCDHIFGAWLTAILYFGTVIDKQAICNRFMMISHHKKRLFWGSILNLWQLEDELQKIIFVACRYFSQLTFCKWL